MDKETLDDFRKMLTEQKKELVEKALHTVKNEIELPPEELIDETDIASLATDHNLNLRLRDRERKLIDKIDHALRRIDQGDFGYCASCEEQIDLERLEARPVTTMCITCKEKQEQKEKQFAD